MTKSNLKEKSETSNNVTGLFIKQIKMKDNRALISLSDDNDFRTQNGDFCVKDEVTEDFKKLWDSAKEIVTALIPQLNKEVPALRLNFINFYYDKKGFLSDVSFSVVWTFDSQGHILNLNLQKFPIYKEEMAETIVAISGKHEDLLHDILDAAKKYMKGETRTKQMKLVVDNTEV